MKEKLAKIKQLAAKHENEIVVGVVCYVIGHKLGYKRGQCDLVKEVLDTFSNMEWRYF